MLVPQDSWYKLSSFLCTNYSVRLNSKHGITLKCITAYLVMWGKENHFRNRQQQTELLHLRHILNILVSDKSNEYMKDKESQANEEASERKINSSHLELIN